MDRQEDKIKIIESKLKSIKSNNTEEVKIVKPNEQKQQIPK